MKSSSVVKTDLAQRRRGLEMLAKVIGGNALFKAGVVAAALVVGAALSNGEAYAQQSAAQQRAQTVASPWTTANGRQAVDLGAAKPAKKNVAKNNARRANPIRQTQALSAPEAPAALLDPLAENPDFSATLEDPASVSNPLLNSASEPATGQNLLDSYDAEDVSEAVAPMPEAVPSPLQTTDEPVANPAPAKPAPAAYPQSDALNQNNKQQDRRGNYYGTGGTPRGNTNNPYSRIGKAEYHPSQFYAGGGNYSVNGYRNTPPAVAYGQSMCGDACPDGSCGGCGIFGGFFQNTQLGANLVGMRSALDFEDQGNFGGDFSINWGSVQPVLGGLHVQAGARSVFTDLNGASANGFETDDNRTQVFWTAGLYFRANECAEGLSLGVVYDSLKDDYYRKYNLQQLRAEVAYSFSGTGEIGFRGAFGLNDDWCDFVKMGDLTAEVKATATDYYTMFYRRQFDQGGEATIYGGVTEWGEGLAGFSAEAPLTDSVALKAAGNYVFAKNRSEDGTYRLKDREEENWNMSLGIVWYLGGTARNTIGSQRPLFDVADNGTFIQNFLRK